MSSYRSPFVVIGLFPGEELLMDYCRAAIIWHFGYWRLWMDHTPGLMSWEMAVSRIY